MREGEKAVNASVRTVRGHVHAIFRNGFERLRRWRRVMNTQLRVHTARELDAGISADRILKRRDDNMRTGRPGQR